TDEGTGSRPGVSDVPSDDSEEEISWNSSDDEDEDQGVRISEEERMQEEEEADELYRDVDINQGRGLQVSQDIKDSHVTLTPTHSDGQQESSSTSSFVTNLLNPIIDPDRVKSLEVNFSEFMRTNQSPEAVSNIPGIVYQYMHQEMTEAVREAVQTQTDRLQDSIQRENDEFLKTIDENMKKIIKEQVKSQVKAQVTRILPRIEESVNAQLEAEVLTRSSHSSRTSYVVAADLSEMELKKILIDKMEGNNESAFAEEPVQTTCQMEEPSHPVFETGAEDPPIVQTSKHPEWFSQPRKPPTPDHTPIDFSNFIMNRLGVDTLTTELLAGPTFELMRGSCNSLTELEYHLEEPLPLIPNNQGRRVIPFAHFINNDLEYLQGGTSSQKYTTSVTKTKAADYGHIKFAVNQESSLDVYSKSRIITVTDLKIVEWHNYKHLDWISRRVEDLQLGIKSFQKRINLTKPDTYRSDLKRCEAYTAYSNPRGFIYQNKDKKNRLIRIDELHKFSDGTLNDVRNALDDRIKGIRMQYLPTTIWRKGDKDRAVAMIQAIDKMLKTRRIIRSLE
nr:hypothetical protein [Tanacetum cinerariifolium]